MKKVISVLLILVMIMALAACGKKEEPAASGNSDVTQAVDNTKDTEPTKAAEPTAEPTKAAEPTAAPEPTDEPEPEPTDEPSGAYDDEFYSAGHVYDGLWQSGDVILAIDGEGAADVFTVYSEETDKETFGSWMEFWTNFSEEDERFESGSVMYYEAEDGTIHTYSEEGTYIFEVGDDCIYWAEMIFEKISDDTSDNPFIVSPDDNGSGDGGDYGDGFGAEFSLENQEFVDVIATTYYGVYCQSADDPMVGTYYPYYGDEMSMETMDESNAAFMYLGMEEDQGQLCFLEKGMNEDVTWSLGKDEFGTYILLDDGYTGEVYKGRFYWDYENTRIMVMIRIGEYDLWLTSDTRVIADTSSSRTMDEETALRAIEKYLAETNESMYEKLQTGDYGTADGVYTDEEKGNIVVWLRSYTGAYRYYYIDPDSGETYVTETSPLTYNSVETPTDETLNAWDYAD